MPQRLQEILEPVVNDLGYELWHMESVGSGPRTTLRLYIDAPEGVNIDDCEKVSHEVSAVLDVADDGRAGYLLEVSSPGLDRPLVTTEHFRQFVGERARMKLYAPVSGHRRLRGIIQSVSDDAVDLACEDGTHEVRIDNMAKARLEPVFN